MTRKLFVLAAGGTGGHLFPAQALAKELLARGYRVALVTDPRFAAYAKGFEGVELYQLPTSKMTGGLKAKLRGAVAIIHSLLFALLLLKRLRPAAVVGFGGYPSFPTMQAAIWLRLPTVIHEQNKLMGRANRILAKGVKVIAASFPAIQGVKEVDKPKVVLVGNPVRPAVLSLRDEPYLLPEAAKKFSLLVFGGSQGAKLFSEVVPAAIALLPDDIRKRLKVVQQARAEELEATIARYSKLGIETDIKSFFEDLPQKLAEAHLVICRAGASTIAEMTVAGRPAFYAPYPYATDDHQRYNAEYVVNAGAGWLLPDLNFTPEALAEKIRLIWESPVTLKDAAAKARELGISDAAEKLASLTVQVAG